MTTPVLAASVDPVEPLLDFHPHSAAANFEWFQRLCVHILNAHPNFENVRQIGIAGDAQEGLDLIGTYVPDGVPWGFQCKQVDEFSAAHVEAAIKKIPKTPQHPCTQYRILLSRSASEKTRQRALDEGNWDVIDEGGLSQLVRELPRDKAIDIVQRYFGRYWVERFLGVEAAGTFATPERFFRPFVNKGSLLHHDRPMRGRDELLDLLRAWDVSDGKVVIVTGRLGTGRSKLLYEFTRGTHSSVAMPLPRHAIDTAALNEIGAGPVIIAVDDADQLDLSTLLGFVARDDDKRLLLTCSPSQANVLTAALVAAGILQSNISTLAVEPLSRAAAIALARDVEPRIHADAVENIVMTCDTPSATIVTTKLMTAPATDAAVAVFNEATALYREVIHGRIDPSLSIEDERLMLRLVAALGPVRPNDAGFLEGVEQLGVTPTKALSTMAALAAAGAIGTFGDRVDVTPSVVRDAILIEACTDHAGVTSFAMDLYRVFGPSKELFHSLASAGEIARLTGRPDFFELVWRQAQKDALGHDHARRETFVKALTGIALLRPADVIRIARKLHNTPPADDSQPYAFYYQVTGAEVDGEIPKVLAPILEYLPTYAQSCINLLWELSTTQTQSLHSSSGDAMRVLRDATGYDGATREARAAIIEAVAKLSKKELDERLHSVLDIIEPVLDTSGHCARSRGDHLEVRTFPVPLSASADARDRVIELCTAALSGESDRRALRAIAILGRLFSTWQTTIEGDDLARLRDEQARVLVAFETVAQEGNALRRAFVRNKLAKYDNRTDALGVHIKSILASLTVDDEMRLLRAIAPVLARHFSYDAAIAPIRGMERHELAVGAERSDAVAMFADEFPDDAAFVDRLLGLVAELANAGVEANLQSFFGQLALTDLDRAAAVGLTVLDAAEGAPLLDALAAVLAALRRAGKWNDPLLQRAETDARHEVRLAAANALRVNLPDSLADASPAIDVLFASYERLLNDDDVDVRTAAMYAAYPFLDRYPARIVPLITSIAETHGDVLDGLFGTLPRDEQGRLQVQPGDFDGLARRLEHVPELGFFEITFLADGFAEHTDLVLEVLAKRLAKPWTRSYSAIPHDPTLDTLTKAAVAAGATASLLNLAINTMTLEASNDFDAKELLKRLLFDAPAETRAALSAAAADADGSRLVLIAAAAAADPERIRPEDADLLTQLVERGFEIDVKTGEEVGEEIRRAIASAPRFSEGRETSTILLRVRDLVDDALTRTEPASEAEQFFTDLKRDVAAEIERERASDEAAYGPA
ncbi:MAG TPA: hypothetical protein VK760_10155 [Candidatus Acidoferrales bacterium]|jgi:hypothetical protein|nr:hypothetical protein [Candidatus Acidoferrales bacterium]